MEIFLITHRASYRIIISHGAHGCATTTSSPKKAANLNCLGRQSVKNQGKGIPSTSRYMRLKRHCVVIAWRNFQGFQSDALSARHFALSRSYAATCDVFWSETKLEGETQTKKKRNVSRSIKFSSRLIEIQLMRLIVDGLSCDKRETLTTARAHDRRFIGFSSSKQLPIYANIFFMIA